MPIRTMSVLSIVLVAQSIGLSQDVAQTVHYRNAAEGYAVQEIIGVTTESPAGVKVQPLGKPTATEIPIEDVVRIEYRALPGVQDTLFFQAESLESKDTPEETHAFFKKELDALKADAAPETKEYFAFREAVWAARVLNQKPMKEFETEAPALILKLKEAAQQARSSWEFWPLYNEAARIALELGDAKTAAEIAGELAIVKGLTPEAQAEAKLMQIAYSLRTANQTTANALLQALEQDGQLPKAASVADRLKVLKNITEVQLPQGDQPVTAADLTNKAPAIANLQATIEAVSDPTAKAYGYNYLGDLYASAGQPREAMWNYLWVDVVYDKNRTERVYAVRKLIDVFTAMKLKERADQFVNKLAEVR